MQAITTQLLDKFPYSLYADSKSIQRGRAYFKDDRVWEVEMMSADRAVCQVEGDSGEYEVVIYIQQASGNLKFSCDCQYAHVGFCKHMIAASLAVRLQLSEDDLDESIDNNDEFQVTIGTEKDQKSLAQTKSAWRKKLENVLVQTHQSGSAHSNLQRYVAVLLMSREGYYYQNSYKLTPFVIKAKNWSALDGVLHGDTQAVNQRLDTNPEWLRHGEEMYSQVNPLGCLNLPPEAISLLQFLLQTTRFYGSLSNFITYFPMLALLQVPIFLVKPSQKVIVSRLYIHPRQVEIQVAFTREQDNLVLSAGVLADTFQILKTPPEQLSSNPPWVLVEDTIYPLSNAASLANLSLFPIKIPETEAVLFRENYLRRVAELFPIQSELIHWSDVDTEPTARLYLHEDRDNKLRASLIFAYDDYEMAACKDDIFSSIETMPESWDMVRVQRKPAREQFFYKLLADPKYLLKRSDTNQPFGTFELRSRAHPFDFLAHAIPQIVQEGIEIFGEENLKLGKINRSTPTLRVQIASGIDWFDLKTVVEFGSEEISLHDVRKALKHGDHYVKLADGSIGQIPDEWLEKYKHLWNLAQETADGFRVNDFHLPLIDSLLAEDPTIQAPPDLTQRRQRFSSFEQIKSLPLPSGFIGELRPYQKHGFDWLHFLREYHFGGILADDMGLGKTVQVLAYLLSQREKEPAAPAVLLVVPKSLITNWQRESERFTPNLRFVEYMGTSRSKDISNFNNYDIVITTYGTMLRDVESLREYKFDTLVLDESQSIKNPLAKSARAARLLDADHRLVMTGTPVENNTFELWSQFAFLNPGLLGSMEYFRSAFATPIESGQDEQTSAMLRKLIYPFILRRTKEQVAPELPPRTERILYTDMNSAQKKLYSQTRERFRAELLGLIEREGMNDARFKILEGLLRLRQIAIHPVLVDKNYKGDAPKFELLLETLETLQVENHKALVFSQFVETLKLVRDELEKRKIKYVYLDGHTSNRQSKVDLFQNDPSFPFFLISLKAGGVGLNLTAADYVIHLDPWWNPAVEMQASDRAHRIGQDKPVFVYKIIARDTVEEKILLLQERKRELVKNLITAESSFFKSLSRDDIKELFE